MRYLIWGTGLRAEELYQANYEQLRKRDIEIIGFIDNRITQKTFHNIMVYSPQDIKQLEYDFIDIWVIHGKEDIKKQIETELNIPSERVKSVFEKYIQKLTLEYENVKQKNSQKRYERPTLELLSACVDRYEGQQWYKYAYKGFEKRKHVYWGYEWIKENIHKDASILEVACGAGGMLYHLHENGYENLAGYDIDERAIKAALDMNRITQGKLEFYVDNAISPQIKSQYDVIVWVNGMYHLPGFDLHDFFDKHILMLKDKGYFVFDMVDIKYNEVPQNEYRTDCWNKEGEKLPSEYKLRMAKDEIAAVASEYEAKLIECFDVNETVPRKVYIVER